MENHVDMLISKISLLTGLIYRLRYFLNVDCLRQIYHSLIYPHFLYCSVIWGRAYKTYIDNLFVTQKNLYESCSLKTVTTIPTVFSETETFETFYYTCRILYLQLFYIFVEQVAHRKQCFLGSTENNYL